MKGDQLNKVDESLEADFVLNVKNAEKKIDSSFASKANALKRKVNETKQDLEKLEEMRALLQKKKTNKNLVYYPRDNYLFKVGKKKLSKVLRKDNFKLCVLCRIS